MPEVFVEISGRKYRMACEEGQEAHLQALAARFDRMVDGFKGDFGEIGDTRLTVMAGIAVLDSLVEAERRIAALNARLDEVAKAGEEVSREYETMERKFARKMDEMARRIDIVPATLNQPVRNGAHRYALAFAGRRPISRRAARRVQETQSPGPYRSLRELSLTGPWVRIYGAHLRE